jgi:hypothetical protein
MPPGMCGWPDYVGLNPAVDRVAAIAADLPIAQPNSPSLAKCQACADSANVAHAVEATNNLVTSDSCAAL